MSNPETTSHVDTFGNTWFEMTVSRGLISHPKKANIGLTYHVRVDPRIEAFVRQLGQGENIDVFNYANDWTPISPANMSIYSFPQASDAAMRAQGFTMLFPGGLPTLAAKAIGLRETVPGEEFVNMSFLRIVGISSPEGVTFGINSAHSTPYVRKLLSDITNHMKVIIRDYISPLKLSSRIYAQG